MIGSAVQTEPSPVTTYRTTQEAVAPRVTSRAQPAPLDRVFPVLSPSSSTRRLGFSGATTRQLAADRCVRRAR
ncbi:unnamed protein product, partial [Nesidiocoris tenuis]